ncbi:MAG: DNA methyltransferase [Planctomycetes bacterium]|nr:DNA methyltransferase [Planctomycetota bacterium]
MKTTERSACVRFPTTRAPDPIALFEEIPLDTKEISQHLLDIANRNRTNPFPWRGQFSPQLVELLLSNYANRGARVFDPFAGVGTTLVEASRLGLPVVGIEINPAAVAMAQTTVFIHCSDKQRQHTFNRAMEILNDRFPLPLFSQDLIRSQLPKVTLADLATEHAKDPYLSNIFTNTLIRLLESSQPDDQEIVSHCFAAHHALVLDLPHSAAECQIIHTDARDLPLPAQSVDLVFTSPPYINVFNYHQNNRQAMELLGWQLLTVAKSEFGSNRKNRSNRLLTVVQYCIDMTAALVELRRVLKPTGRAIFIVGRESNVRGLSFRNGAIVVALASLAGFQLVLRQERKFTNKFGAVIYEDILHLQPTSSEPIATDATACQLAQEILQKALPTCRLPDVRADLLSAIDAATRVSPSPIFNPHDALNQCQ